jgi:hypothetical protein
LLRKTADFAMSMRVAPFGTSDRIEPRDNPSLGFSVKLTPSTNRITLLQTNMIGETCERTDSKLSGV